MKQVLLVLASFCVFAKCFSQNTEAWLDGAGRPTSNSPRFIRSTESKEGLYYHETVYLPEKTIASRFVSRDAEGKLMHGEFVEYYPDGKLKTKGTYADGKKAGEYLRYYPDGIIREKGYYSSGSRRGTNILYHPNAVVSDSISGDGQGNSQVYIFYKSGIRMSEGTMIDDTSKHNTWIYYDEQGKRLAIEENDHGKVTSVICLDSSGKALPEGACGMRKASYMKGETEWRRFLGSILDPDVPVRRKAPPGSYTVMIRFAILPDGQIGEMVPLTAYGYGMEEEVIRAIGKSRRWGAASRYGQPITEYRMQPITFEVPDLRKKKKNHHEDRPVSPISASTKAYLTTCHRSA